MRYLKPMICLQVLAMLLFTGCRDASDKGVRLPSKEYRYVAVDKATLNNRHAVYVPVYSHIYPGNKNAVLDLAATLSIRNTSFTDSFYVTDVVYYGSQGEVLRKYLDATLVVRPMCSVEFVVERSGDRGGAGANFVVNWASKDTLANDPLIQTVMVVPNAGVSFVTNGVEIRP